MFFKRLNKSKPETAFVVEASAEVAGLARVPSLPASQLRRETDPASLGFSSTAELELGSSLIGQGRALKAIEFGTAVDARDYNIFVMGPPASGKSTAVRDYLKQKAAIAPAPAEWVYVNNFEDANAPRALRLPPGRAKALARAMIVTIEELRTTLPAAFESEDFQSRKRAIDEGSRAQQENAFEELNRKATEQNIAILRTPMGFTMAPMHDGKVVKPEVYNQLPEEMRQQVESRVVALQKELAAILAAAPKAEKLRRARLSELAEEVSLASVAAAIDDVKAEFADLPEVIRYLDAAESDLVRNAGLFLSGSGDEAILKEPVEVLHDPRFRRYMVNVLVSSAETQTGAPIYEETNPTFGNLIGRIEHIAQMGALVTDFLLIKAGALHRANGGYLLLDARKVLMSPYAWEALKRALKTAKIRIETPMEALGLVSTQSLDAEAVPLSVKVILFGEPEHYYLLSQYDPDFSRLFKVQADFDDKIDRDPESEKSYARLVASVASQHKLKPVAASGVARIIDEGARLADHSGKLSIEIGRIADIVREADHWAGIAGRKEITADDIAAAVNERVERAGRIRDRTQEAIERGLVLVDTEGAKAGQINALSVHQFGDFSFGRPSRITARVRMGQGRVTDIEREVKLGGPLHSKGVMILWGYLAGRFAQDVPLALAATLVFEQSYSGVDGDSASSAELYALLSALAEVPIDQGLAVTGSVNQWGEVQTIGAVNEKIEGFFDVCRQRGLTGRQGVIIPEANIQNLMLRVDVVKAVADGQFSIYPVSTVDQGIEILTGVRAGERGATGEFEPSTINRRVEDKLKSFAERARRFSASSSESNARGGT
jgi:lon-related putative ATP-dependent protease